MAEESDRYWMDADVFIQSKNGPYGFDIAPGFWRRIELGAADGILRSIKLVYDELARGNDELVDWAKVMNTNGFFVSPDESVQLALRDVAAHVKANWEDPYVAEFFDGADPWIIAQAKADSGIVVTRESAKRPNARKVRIPDVTTVRLKVE